MIGKDAKKVAKKVTLKEGKPNKEWVGWHAKGELFGLVEFSSCL